MSNPSSPATSTAGEQHDQDQADEAALQRLQAPDEHAAAGIIPSDEAKLSPPRCEWEFRLVATVPSPALAGASDAIGSVDFDHTGRHLATGGIARKIRIYRVAEPSSPAGCICVPAKLSSVRWRPGGGDAAVEAAVAHVGCGDYDGVVTEYDVERGVPVWERDEHEGRRVWALDYAGGGAAMVASGSDDRTAHVWDPRAPAGAAGWATARAGGAVLCLEFDPAGGPQLAVGSADRRAVVYDVRALGRGAVASMNGHGRAVTYVRWAAPEPAPARRVVTSAADSTHRLWALQAAAEAPAREVRSYSGHVSGRSFVGMGVWRGAGLIASGSESGHVFVYDLRWSKPIWVHPFAADAATFVSAVAWRQGGDNDGEDGQLVAGGSDGVLKLFTCHRRLSSDVGDDDDDVAAC
ncbi:hypothetical protein E2562_025001 [Oryza meyeriana var. granulata]|uniref:Uncharacterized protein n=1 Tax=Oryza meyeriana var. granulata TaxID=110450 RepID=A0A6G1FC58_9ORYZ|nr:hypothetical protein E2562_025001 [Oryza meyeriana var. granulata]